jgi:hypothetical protein
LLGGHRFIVMGSLVDGAGGVESSR